MRIVWLLLTGALLNADTTLSSLIEGALGNEKIQSRMYQVNAASAGYASAVRSYLPRVDAFGSAAFVDRTGGFDAKASYSAGLRGEVVVFDGFRRENLLAQNRSLEAAARHQLQSAKKELSLEVIERFFDLQNTLDEIETLVAVRDQLSAQLERLQKFRTAGLASDDALMRMRSELSDTHYRIEDLRYQSDRRKIELETLTGRPLATLVPAEVIAPAEAAENEPDHIQALRHTRDAKIHEASQKDASALPTLKLEDHFSVYDYHNDPIAAMRVDRQNKFIASLNMNLIDFSAASLAREALAAQARAQSSELAYALKETRATLQSARRYIERTRGLIASSQSAYDAAEATFAAVRQKYEARIVDYVVYLDALRTRTDAINRLTRAKRELYYAYAAYYFYAGHDPREYVR